MMANRQKLQIALARLHGPKRLQRRARCHVLLSTTLFLAQAYRRHLDELPVPWADVEEIIEKEVDV